MVLSVFPFIIRARVVKPSGCSIGSPPVKVTFMSVSSQIVIRLLYFCLVFGHTLLVHRHMVGIGIINFVCNPFYLAKVFSVDTCAFTRQSFSRCANTLNLWCQRLCSHFYGLHRLIWQQRFPRTFRVFWLYRQCFACQDRRYNSWLFIDEYFILTIFGR